MPRKTALAGSIGLLLVATLHGIGHFGAPPADPAFRAAWSAMAGSHLSLGFGWQPSLVDVWNSQSLTMLVLVAALGLINFAIARSPRATEGGRLVVTVTAIACAVLALVNAGYRVGLPAAFFVIAAVLFGVAAVKYPATPGAHRGH